MSIINTLTEMLNSIIAYFGAFNFDEVLASVKLILENLDFETFSVTFDALKEFLAAIFG